jgi:hypothetical protein
MEKISTAEIFAAAIMFEQIKRALHVSCELPSRNLYKSHARFLSLRSEMLSPRSLSQAASIIAASAAGREGGAGQKVANRVGWSLSDYRHVLRSSRLSAQMHFSLPPLASRCGRCIRNALHRKKQWIAAINRLEARENTRRHKIEPHIFFYPAFHPNSPIVFYHWMSPLWAYYVAGNFPAEFDMPLFWQSPFLGNQAHAEGWEKSVLCHRFAH